MTIKIIITAIVTIALLAGAFWIAKLVEDGKKAGVINHNYVGLDEENEDKQ